MPMQFVDLKAQYLEIQTAIDARIRRVLDHGQYIMGPEVGELEHRLATYVGSTNCIAVSSGTDALLIAMMALGVGPGDEVITSPFTFIATAEAITLLHARPVFVDIEARTFNVDVTRIEAAITPRTRAIVPVSLYGQCADMDALNTLGTSYGIPVIEDAAQSFGATYRGRRSCALSTIGCTSFFPSKPLGGYGDGGAAFTDDAALADRMRQIRIHGQGRRYHHQLIGVNGRLDTIQAAILLAKFDIFPDEVAARTGAAQRYTDLLSAHCPAVQAPYIEPWNTSVYAQYKVELENRAAVVQTLTDQSVPTAIHYPVPLHRQPVFESLGYGAGSFPIAEAAAERVLSLPMHAYLNEADQALIVSALAGALD